MKQIYLIILLLITPSCVRVETKAEYPEFSTVEKPQLQIITKNELSGVSNDTIIKLLKNDQALKDYSARLRAQIDEYMKWRSEQR